MRFLVTIALLAFTSAAFANNDNNVSGSNVNICQPKIEVKSCGSNCCKPKTVTKVVEKVVEKEVVVEKQVVKSKKNHLSLLGGVGPKGNLKVEQSGSEYRAETENGPVIGLQYMRELKSGDSTSVDGLIQVQSNRTFMIGVGVGF